MDKKELQEFYSGHVKSLSADILKLKRRGRAYLAGELLTFLLAFASFSYYCVGGLKPMYLVIALIFFAEYIVVRVYDSRNDKRILRLMRLRLVYGNELRYLDGDFTCFDRGDSFIDSQHAYSYDLDLYGKNSLFNRINRTVTSGGNERLAEMLGYLSLNKNKIELRRHAIYCLADNETWRSQFVAEGQRITENGISEMKTIDTGAILSAFDKAAKLKLPTWMATCWSSIASFLLMVGLFYLIVMAVIGLFPASFAIMYAILLLFLVLSLTAGPLRKIGNTIGSLLEQTQLFISLIHHISTLKPQGDELETIHSTLFGDHNNALEAFDKLSNTLSAIDRRGNVLGMILGNIFFHTDFHTVRGFLNWQETYASSLSKWVDAVSRIDALVSMATFMYNEQNTVEPELLGSHDIVYKAENLRHPFLGDKCVGNDFEIKHLNYYIVTGANMAGKSTFLRSVGINYVLAMNGMRVFSDRFQISMFALFTSMRTSDDLSQGVSYFNAELLRLSKLIDFCSQNKSTLIILDEILKGTNSVDKLRGSRLFLEEIAKMNVAGIVATHDLELSKMETDYPDRFHNYCFEIQLADILTYSYKISKGVAHNQNATYLLQRMIAGELS